MIYLLRFFSIYASILFCVTCHIQDDHHISNLNSPNTFFVSNDGSDNNQGSSIFNPFKTIQRAQLAVRRLKNQYGGSLPNDITIFLMADKNNYFFINSTIIFNEEDGGDQLGHKVIFKTYSSQGNLTTKAIISGGYKVTSNWINPNQTNPLLWQTVITDPITYSQQLFADEQRRVAARTNVTQYESAEDTYIIYQQGQITSVPSNLDQVQIVLYECQNAPLHQISGIELGSRKITLETPFNSALGSSCSGKRFYIENMVEALNQSGYFYLDRQNSTLYYYSYDNENPNNLSFIIPQLKELIVIQGLREPVINLQFENIQFSHTLEDTITCFQGSCNDFSASFLNTSAVHISQSQFISFYNVAFAHLGGYALWFGSQSTDSVISDSKFNDLGAGGIRVGEPVSGIVDEQILVQRVTVNNSVLTDGSHFFESSSGILIQGASYTSILHCEISDFLYSGISLGWTTVYGETNLINNQIAYNHIFDIGNRTLSGMGGIETMGHLRNSLIYNNLIHDIYSYSLGGWGIKLNGGTRQLTVQNNIVYYSSSAGFYQYFGSDNLVKNNIFFLTDYDYQDGAVVSQTRSGKCSQKNPNFICASFEFVNNIVFVDSVDYSDLVKDDNQGMKNMTFSNNVYYTIINSIDQIKFPPKNQLSWKQWRKSGQDSNSLYTDPKFIDAYNFNLQLQPTSPAYDLGIKDIDVSKVGPITY